MRQNMKAERARLGLSCEEVAERIGIHPNTLRRWESGEGEPLAKKFLALVHLYGCTADYLMGFTEDRHGVAVANHR